MKNAKRLFFWIGLIFTCQLQGQIVNFQPINPDPLIVPTLNSMYTNYEAFEIPCIEDLVANVNNPFDTLTLMIGGSTYLFERVPSSLSNPNTYQYLSLDYSINEIGYLTLDSNRFELKFLSDSLELYERFVMTEDSCKWIVIKTTDDPDEEDPCDLNLFRTGVIVAYDLYIQMRTEFLINHPNWSDDRILKEIESQAANFIAEAGFWWGERLNRTILVEAEVHVETNPSSDYCNASSSGILEAVRYTFGTKQPCKEFNSGIVFISDCRGEEGAAALLADFCERSQTPSDVPEFPAGYVEISDLDMPISFTPGGELHYFSDFLTMVHEMGHMLGMPHPTNPPCIFDGFDIMGEQGSSTLKAADITVADCNIEKGKNRLDGACDCMKVPNAPCSSCEFYDITLNPSNTPVLAGCDGNNTFELVITAANDCDLKNNHQLQITFSSDLDDNQIFEIVSGETNDFLADFVVESSPGSPTKFHLRTPVFNFQPEETRTFTVTLKMVSFNYGFNGIGGFFNVLTAVKRTAPNGFWEYAGETVGASGTIGTGVYIEGTKTLSQLAASHPKIPSVNPGCSRLPRIIVEEELIIDIDGYCLNAEIIFNPGARLTVNPGIRTQFKQSRLHPCSDMWDGVILEPGASLQSTETSIEDALTGIYQSSGSSASLYQTTLQRCYYGVLSGEGEQGAYLGISNSVIDGTGGLINPLSGETMEAGILFNGGYVSLAFVPPFPGGPQLIAGPVIKEGHAGVVGYNSNIYIAAASISSISKGSGDEYDGHAIYADGISSKTLTVGSKFGGAVVIDDVHQGVYSKRNSVLIEDIGISNSIFGIEIGPSNFLTYEIIGNTIDVIGFGVKDFFSGAIFGDIKTNDIQSTNSGAACIDLDGVWGFSDVVVRDNFLSSPTNGAGVSLNVCEGIAIENNTIIQQGDGSTARGIEVIGSKSIITTCNIVNGGNAGTEGQGIYIENTPFAVVSCNDVLSSAKGVQLVDGCLGSNIAGNGMSGHADQGLLYGRNTGGGGAVGASTGPQSYTGNLWNLADADHLGVFNEILQSPYTINTTQGPQFGPDNLVDMTALQWFIPENLLGNFNCNTSGACQGGKGILTVRSGSLDSSNIDIASGNFTLGSFAEPRLWNMQNQLFEQMNSGQVSYSQDSILQQFYLDANNGNLGILKQATTWNSVATTPGNEQDSLIAMFESMLSIDSLNYINFYDSSSTNHSSFSPIIANMALTDSMLGVSSVLNSSTWDVELLNMQAVLGNLALPNNMETQMKNVLDIHFNNQMAEDSLNYLESQKTLLQAIAIQCPYEHGPAVYWARALLSGIDTIKYNDNLCAISTLRGTEGIQDKDVYIYPNPSSNHIMVGFNVGVSQRAEWTMINSYGQTVKKGKFLPGLEFHYLDLARLTSGTYYLQITYQGESQIGKFVVMK